MEENKYSKGKIYKLCIKSNIQNDGEIYIGSTIEPYLCNRIGKHRSDYKRFLDGKMNNILSFKLFEKYGLNNVEIVLLENYPCNSKQELHARERYYIENNLCVNKIIVGRT